MCKRTQTATLEQNNRQRWNNLVECRLRGLRLNAFTKSQYSHSRCNNIINNTGLDHFYSVYYLISPLVVGSAPAGCTAWHSATSETTCRWHDMAGHSYLFPWLSSIAYSTTIWYCCCYKGQGQIIKTILSCRIVRPQLHLVTTRTTICIFMSNI